MRPTLPPKAPVVVIESQTHTAAPIASPVKWRKFFQTVKLYRKFRETRRFKKFRREILMAICSARTG